MEMFILKEKIIKETLNLLNTKTFDKITIKDITDNLNISRQAFYYHFNDLYEVVETICTNSYKMVTNTYTDLEDWKFVYLYILRLIYTHNIYEATTDADALVVVTEWKEFRLPAWATLQRVMRGCVIADGRNIYNGEKLRQMGFTYYKIG